MILWLLFIILEILRNYYLIEVKKQRPDYSWSFVIRAFCGFVILILKCQDFDPLIKITIEQLRFTLFQAVSFWVLFDPGLNKMRKKPWNYQGKNSGWLDKLPKPVNLILKLLSLALLLLLYILI